MLSAQGIGVPDRALGDHVHPRHDQMARIVAQVAVCEALGDRAAWATILGDDATRTVQDSRGRDVAVLRGQLAAYRVIYGNRKEKRARRR